MSPEPAIPVLEDEAWEDPREWVRIACMMASDGVTVKDIAEELDRSYTKVWDALHPYWASVYHTINHNRRCERFTAATCVRCDAPMSSDKTGTPICKRCERAHARRNDATIIDLARQGLRSHEIAAVLPDMNPQDVRGRIGNIRTRGIDVPSTAGAQ